MALWHSIVARILVYTGSSKTITWTKVDISNHISMTFQLQCKNFHLKNVSSTKMANIFQNLSMLTQ